LKLHDHGLRLIERRTQNFLPLPDGRHLLMGEGQSEREIAKFSIKDAERYPAYRAEIGNVADVLRSTMLNAPPNLRLDSVRQAWREIGSLLAIGKNLWKADALKAVFRLLRTSAGEILDSWFDSDPIKAVLGFDAVVGNLASPYTEGSACVLLHHMLGEVNGKRGVWGHAIGGMGAITQAIAKAACAHGVRIAVGCEVSELIVERGRAVGVVLDDGTPIRARASLPTSIPSIYSRI
jgi:phytoene dehydrogenase-like protein